MFNLRGISVNKLEKAKYDKERYRKNRDKMLAEGKQYRKLNPDYDKTRYTSNKELMKTQSLAAYQKNRNARLQQMKIYRELHKERINAQSRKWFSKNKGLMNAHNAKRRAAKLNATVSWAKAGLIERYYKIAQFLSKTMNEQYHVDHMIPLQGSRVCGLHCENNLQIITAKNNLSKHNNWEN